MVGMDKICGYRSYWVPHNCRKCHNLVHIFTGFQNLSTNTRSWKFVSLLFQVIAFNDRMGINFFMYSAVNSWQNMPPARCVQHMNTIHWFGDKEYVLWPTVFDGSMAVFCLHETGDDAVSWLKTTAAKSAMKGDTWLVGSCVFKLTLWTPSLHSARQLSSRENVHFTGWKVYFTDVDVILCVMKEIDILYVGSLVVYVSIFVLSMLNRQSLVLGIPDYPGCQLGRKWIMWLWQEFWQNVG